MIRSRWIIFIGVAFAALLAFGGTANAQDEPTVAVDPQVGLADGDTVTVTVSGFPADSTAFSAGQCVAPIEDFLAQCDLGNIQPVALDSSGGATLEIVVSEGTIGSGTCGEGADQCVIAVGSLTESQAGGAPIFFGADAPPAPEGEDLADTGPREVAISLIVAFAALIAGFMLVSTSRRRIFS